MHYFLVINIPLFDYIIIHSIVDGPSGWLNFCYYEHFVYVSDVHMQEFL